ncbi:hypothetical protein SOVF_182280 [Spinacia oleracea]|nr:hypothetical protein SOVF_182280 [Spinacia oleracea]
MYPRLSFWLVAADAGVVVGVASLSFSFPVPPTLVVSNFRLQQPITQLVVGLLCCYFSASCFFSRKWVRTKSCTRAGLEIVEDGGRMGI